MITVRIIMYVINPDTSRQLSPATSRPQFLRKRIPHKLTNEIPKNSKFNHCEVCVGSLPENNIDARPANPTKLLMPQRIIKTMSVIGHELLAFPRFNAFLFPRENNHCVRNRKACRNNHAITIKGRKIMAGGCPRSVPETVP